MSHRFFVTSVDREQAVLEGSEAHHLLHVMRAGVGAEVVLFDGSGAEYTARVSQIDRTRVRLSVLECVEVDRELAVNVTLAVALPKGDRQRWLVEKAVELGVSRLVPIKTERGVAQPGDAAVQRLRRTVIEAAKQCRRNRLTDIERPCDFTQFADVPEKDAVRLIAHPGGERVGDVLEDADGSPASGISYFVAVGPEGGFTDAEIGFAVERGWRTVDLGPRTLRIETAAVALAVVLAMR